jgi:hypothetical protein
VFVDARPRCEHQGAPVHHQDGPGDRVFEIAQLAQRRGEAEQAVESSGQHADADEHQATDDRAGEGVPALFPQDPDAEQQRVLRFEQQHRQP